MLKRLGALILLVVAVLQCRVAGEGYPSLRDLVETRNFTRGQPTRLEFTPDGRHLLFLRSGPRDDRRSLFEFSIADGSTREVLTAKQVLGEAGEVLSAAERARRERMRLTASGLADYHLSKDGRSILLPLASRLYVLDRTNGQVKEIPQGQGAIDPRWSGDAHQVAYVLGHDVYVSDLRSGKRSAVTQGGTDSVSFGLAEFVAQEELLRMHGFWWSPDGRQLLVERADARSVEVWRVPDPMNPDHLGEPQFYPRPGRSNVVVNLGVFPVSGGKPQWLAWDHQHYPYVVDVNWDAKGGLTVQVMSRDQKDLALLKADPKSGVTQILVSVRDEAWVNFVPGLIHWMEDGGGFIWATEQETSWRLELRNPSGGLMRELASGASGPQLSGWRTLQFDAPSGNILFPGGTDPSRAEVWKADLRAGSAIRLSGGAGSATGVMGPRGLYALQTSSPTSAPVWTVHRGDGSIVGVVPSVAEVPNEFPRVDYAHIGEGAGYNVKINRPRNFDPTKRYPVIDAVYGGPGSRVVNQGFGGFMDQWMADHGFIVVAADGRGTPGFGRGWERAITNHFGDLPLDEQINALQAMGARYPELDLDRVGITGWSFGGYLSAAAALRRPDFFKASISGAPVTDWLDYDTCYTERYLGVPGPGDTVYPRNSLLDDARSLKCPLLLIHGTTDDNVFFRHSLKLADALFRNGQPYEFLPLSGFTHMVPDPAVREQLELRMVRFFQQHLGGPQRR